MGRAAFEAPVSSCAVGLPLRRLSNLPATTKARFRQHPTLQHRSQTLLHCLTPSLPPYAPPLQLRRGVRFSRELPQQVVRPQKYRPGARFNGKQAWQLAFTPTAGILVTYTNRLRPSSNEAGSLCWLQSHLPFPQKLAVCAEFCRCKVAKSSICSIPISFRTSHEHRRAVRV